MNEFGGNTLIADTVHDKKKKNQGVKSLEMGRQKSQGSHKTLTLELTDSKHSFVALQLSGCSFFCLQDISSH